MLLVGSWCVCAAAGGSQGNLRARGFEASVEAAEHQLSMIFGHGENDERMTRLEGLLRPTVAAMPKNEDGGLDLRAVRYALKRHFMVHHGWTFEGLGNYGTRNDTSPASLLKSKMPSSVLETLVERLGTRRIGLHEMALLVATVEDVVRSDALDLLRIAYERLSLPMDARLDRKQAVLVIKSFGFFHIRDSSRYEHDGDELQFQMAVMRTGYPRWPDMVLQ